MMLDFLGFFINLSNQTKMCIRLFMPFTLLFILGLFIQYFSESTFQNISSTPHASNTVYVTDLVGQLLYYLDWIGLFVMAIALLGFIWQTYRLWQWENGNIDNCCHVCGGIVSERSGRWGDYYKCLACGNNRSIR